MPLAPDFQFNQNNLQDYVDCPRRFQLRHIQRLAWPALQSEPVLEQERHMQMGQRFHHMVHQHLLGLSGEALSAQTGGDADLLQWWDNYLNHPLPDLPARRYPEFILSAPFAGYRLLAKFDLLALEPGQRAVVVDWKTARRRPAPLTLQARLQTRLYPFLAVNASATLNGGQPFAPEQVEMVYWFTNFPDQPLRLPYSTRQYQEDAALLQGLIAEISGRSAEIFPLTAHEQRCVYCTYRSLCQRGVRAGEWQDLPEEEENEDGPVLDLPFDQIGEIEF